MKPHNRNDRLGGSVDARDLLDEIASSETVALSVEPVSPGASLRDGVLASASAETRLEAYAARAAHFFDVDLEHARGLLGSTLDPGGADWIDDPTPGTRILPFQGGSTVEGARCMLIHMQPGVDYPAHLHLGDEWCLFLGGRIVETERELHPGDLVLNPAGSHHAVQHAAAREPSVFGIVVYEGVRFDEQR